MASGKRIYLVLSGLLISSLFIGCGKRAVLKSNRYDDSGKEYESEYTLENYNENENNEDLENRLCDACCFLPRLPRLLQQRR